MKTRITLKQRPRVKTISAQRIIISTSFAVVLALGLMLTINLTDNRITRAATNGDYRSAASGSWASASTWEKYDGTSWVTATSAPSDNDGVITICNGHTVTTGSVSADQVIIDAGGQLTMSANTLTLRNGTGADITVNGTLLINGGTLTMSSGTDIEVNGTLTLSSGTMTVNSSSIINVNNGGLFQRNGGTLSLPSGTLSFNNGGTYQHTYNGSTIPSASWSTGSTCLISGITSLNSAFSGIGGQTFYNFVYNCPSQTANPIMIPSSTTTTTTFNGTLTIVSTGSGTLYFNKYLDGATNTYNINNLVVTGGTIDLNDHSLTSYPPTYNFSGNITVTGGSIISTSTCATPNGSINFTYSGTQNLAVTSPGTCALNLFTIQVKSGAILNLGTNIISGTSASFTLASGGGLIIGSTAGITSSGATGNVQVTGTRSFSTSGNYTYNASAAQVTGNGLPATVNNLVLDNSSNLTLTNTVSVSGILVLTNGKIITGANELRVTNSSASAVLGYSSSNYIIGNLRRSVNASGAYDFPVGTSTNYELANVTLSSMTGFTNILGSFTNANPIEPSYPLTDIYCNGTPITDMLNYGYWTLTPNTAMTGGTYTVTLNEKGHTNPASDPMSYCVIKRSNSSSSWQSLGTHDNNTQSESGGVAVATRSALTSFSDFGIGKGGGALPIELVYFTVQPEGNVVDCSWQTASEVNNDFFTIERSLDGKNFSSIGNTDGSGNSSSTLSYSFNDESPSRGIAFYRLKQTDFDGRFTFSKIKSVNFAAVKPSDALSISSVAPNPFMDNFSVTYALKQNADVNLSISNASGQIVYETQQNALAGTNRFDFAEGNNLPKGLYFIKISYDNNSNVQRIIKN